MGKLTIAYVAVIFFALSLAVSFPERAFGEDKVDMQKQGERSSGPDEGRKSELNTGQDMTKPLRRIDVRYQFAEIPNRARQHIFTVRTDQPFEPAKKWLVGLRLDLPFVYGDVKTSDNIHKRYQFTTADLLFQAIAGYIPNERIAFGAGTQFIFPTAYREQGGSGKYRLAPVAGMRVSLPEIAKASFFLFSVMFDFDYAGESKRSHVRLLKFAPTLNIVLPTWTFITLFSSQEIVYDCLKRRFRLPVNFTIGQMITRRIVASMEFFIPLIRTKSYKPYDFKTEARIGFFF